MNKKIVITIAPSGEVKVEAAGGFKGTECLDATKVFEEALGAAGERTRKPEMFAATTGVTQKVKG